MNIDFLASTASQQLVIPWWLMLLIFLAGGAVFGFIGAAIADLVVKVRSEKARRAVRWGLIVAGVFVPWIIVWGVGYFFNVDVDYWAV